MLELLSLFFFVSFLCVFSSFCVTLTSKNLQSFSNVSLLILLSYVLCIGLVKHSDVKFLLCKSLNE